MTADELIGILAPLVQQERAGLARHVRYLQEEVASKSERIDYFDAALAIMTASIDDERQSADREPLRPT
jgi:hypothetical protein